jgi:hypothetical protein
MLLGVGVNPPAAVQYALDTWIRWTRKLSDIHTHMTQVISSTRKMMTFHMYACVIHMSFLCQAGTSTCRAPGNKSSTSSFDFIRRRRWHSSIE